MVKPGIRTSGVVKVWDRLKGWGFLSTDLDDPEADEFYAHASSVLEYDRDVGLLRSQCVTFVPVSCIKNGELEYQASAIKTANPGETE